MENLFGRMKFFTKIIFKRKCYQPLEPDSINAEDERRSKAEEIITALCNELVKHHINISNTLDKLGDAVKAWISEEDDGVPTSTDLVVHAETSSPSNVLEIIVQNCNEHSASQHWDIIIRGNQEEGDVCWKMVLPSSSDHQPAKEEDQPELDCSKTVVDFEMFDNLNVYFSK